MEKPSLIEKLDKTDGDRRRLLGIFVKAPVAGKVKTRLTPPLSPEEAARLYEVAMRETIDRFVAAGFQVVLFYAGNRDYFAKGFPELPLVQQVEGNLGQRMEQALAQLLSSGSRVALIGSDSPDLPADQVAAAFNLLADHDVVTIPADDGGYVLIGCSRPCPELFRDVPWSSASVLATTRERAADQQLRFAETGGWSDVDDISTLNRLVNRSPDTATARFARTELAGYLE